MIAINVNLQFLHGTAKGSLKASFLELLKTWCPGASWGDLVGSLELWIPLIFKVQSGRTTTLLRAHAAQQRGTIENDKIFKACLSQGHGGLTSDLLFSRKGDAGKGTLIGRIQNLNTCGLKIFGISQKRQLRLIAGKHTASSEALPAGRLRPGAARRRGKIWRGAAGSKADDSQRLTISGGDLYRAHNQNHTA